MDRIIIVVAVKAGRSSLVSTFEDPSPLPVSDFKPRSGHKVPLFFCQSFWCFFFDSSSLFIITLRFLSRSNGMAMDIGSLTPGVAGLVLGMGYNGL
jgi:hypothetical protein